MRLPCCFYSKLSLLINVHSHNRTCKLLKSKCYNKMNVGLCCSRGSVLSVITMSKQPLHTLLFGTPQIHIMAEQLPQTDPFFAPEEESNIINNMNDWVLPIPIDPPLPLAVAQESRPDQEMTQLVLSIPHRPCRRMEDGEMVCGALGKRVYVLQENVLPPVQATTHHRGHRDELVCPPLVRNGGAEMWLQQAEIVCSSVVTSPLSYEEGSEVVCGRVGWGRTAQSLPHQTSNTTEPSSVVYIPPLLNTHSTMYSSAMWNNLGATGTLNTTHHYIPQLLPSLRETTTPNAPVAVNAHFSYECHSLEECRPKSGIPREAVGDPPPTQQLVLGRMT